MRLAGLVTAGLAFASMASGSNQGNSRNDEYYKSPSTDLAPPNAGLGLNQGSIVGQGDYHKGLYASGNDGAKYHTRELSGNEGLYLKCRADVSSDMDGFYDNLYVPLNSVKKAEFDTILTNSGVTLSEDKLNLILDFAIDNPLEVLGFDDSESAVSYLQSGDLGHSCIDTTETNNPTGQPTGQPSGQPSGQPTGQPTGQPSGQPTGQPTGKPTTSVPTSAPTTAPTTPSAAPSSSPTHYGLVLYDCNNFPDMKKDCLQMNHLYEYSNKASGFNIDFGIPSGVASPDLVYDYLSYDPVDMIDSYKSYKDIAKKFDGVAGYPAFQEWDSSCQSQLEGLVDSSQPSHFTDVKNFLELCEDSSETVLKNLRDEVYVTVEQAGEAIDLIATSLEHTGKNQEKDLKGSKGKEPKKMSVSTEFPSNDFFNHGDEVATLSAHGVAYHGVAYPGVEISNIEDLSVEAVKQHDDTAFSYGTAWTFLVGAAVAVVSGSAYLYCTQKNTDEEQNEGIDQNRGDIESNTRGLDGVASDVVQLSNQVSRLMDVVQAGVNMVQGAQYRAPRDEFPLHPNVDVEEVDVAPRGNPVPMLDPRVDDNFQIVPFQFRGEVNV